MKNPKEPHKVSRTPAHLCGVLLVYTLLVAQSCASRAMRLQATISAVQQQLGSVKQALSDFNAAAGRADNAMWQTPGEITVFLRSKRRILDDSPRAKRMARELRSSGAAGFTGLSSDGTNTYWYDDARVAPGGLMVQVSDQATVKLGGDGGQIEWQSGDFEKILDAGNKLQQTFITTQDKLKQTASSQATQQEMATVLKHCEEGRAAAAALSEAAKELNAAVEASEQATKVKETAIQAIVRRLVTSWGAVHTALASAEAACQRMAAPTTGSQ